MSAPAQQSTAAGPRLVAGKTRPIAITGGAGFIGCNLAASLMDDGHPVRVIDNLGRPGVARNLDWLEARHKDRLETAILDVRDFGSLRAALKDVAAVFHFAAQTAVTTSLDDPAGDFSVNALGTLNVLEAVRTAGRRAPVIFSSTNKVYGGLADIALAERADRHEPEEPALRGGIGEDRPLDFCTPYGCSKGAADQYVRDYAHSYGLPTAVMRMSCIYGPHQFGTEDQGWVAHFLIRALSGKPITIYGDGKQVRDILHVRDAVDAYRAVLARIDEVEGQAFNLGGGPGNAVSLDLLLAEIGRLSGRAPAVGHGPWRAGDQFWFVADTGKLEGATGWRAKVGWREGVADLYRWLRDEQAAEAADDRKARGRALA